MPRDDEPEDGTSGVEGEVFREADACPGEEPGNTGPLRPPGDKESPDGVPCLPEREPPAEEDKMSVVEALLFVSPSPLSTGSIAEITGIDQGAVREILNRLTDYYSERMGGLVVREVAGGFGFYAVPAAAPYIARLISSQVNPRLTRAALESMAIVAYLQPVSRGLVAEIRGVQSESVIKTLEDRGLVRPAGRGGPPGYPVLYATTPRFMERFGLKSLEELPPLENFSPDEEMVEKIKRSLSWELMDGEGARGERGIAGVGEGGPDAAGAGAYTEDTVGSGAGLEEGVGEADTVGPGDDEREDGGPGR